KSEARRSGVRSAWRDSGRARAGAGAGAGAGADEGSEVYSKPSVTGGSLACLCVRTCVCVSQREASERRVTRARRGEAGRGEPAVTSASSQEIRPDGFL